MAFLSNQWRISFLYDIVNTDEVAQCGLSVALALPLQWTAGPTEDDCEDFDTAYRAFLAANGLDRANYSRYLGVKAAWLDTAGHYIEDAAEFYGTPLAGTAEDVMPQTTSAVSLRSGSTTGKGNYGRMYIPYSRMGLQAGTPYGTTARQQLLRDAAVQLVEDVNNIAQASAGTALVRIMSQVAGVQGNKPVSTVAVGRVNDTQRRRRNRLDEQYSFGTVNI